MFSSIRWKRSSVLHLQQLKCVLLCICNTFPECYMFSNWLRRCLNLLVLHLFSFVFLSSSAISSWPLQVWLLRHFGILQPKVEMVGFEMAGRFSNWWTDTCDAEVFVQNRPLISSANTETSWYYKSPFGLFWPKTNRTLPSRLKPCFSVFI